MDSNVSTNKPWHEMSVAEVEKHWEVVAKQGLSSAQHQQLVERFGPNELISRGGRGPWRILWEQFSGAMVLLLIGAAVVSLVLHEITDAIVILAIVILNALLGFFQDYRAEQALAALEKMAVPKVKVRRDGVVRELTARDLTPGDVVLLEAGGQAPADCRLIDCSNLKIQESALTGESEPVLKQDEPLSGRLPVADRANMAYMGTVVTYGRGTAIVIATGMQTELGQIATSLDSVEGEQTPLQRRLAQLGRTLALVALAIVAVLFVLGLMRGEDPRLMLMTSLSLAVAVVPEGLPAVATVSLALGARRMFNRNALIRRLPAVETLGSVNIICSDKTGTLTQNKMTVTVLDVAGNRLDLMGGAANKDSSEHSSGAPTVDDQQPSAKAATREVIDNSSLELLLAGAGLCNDAELHFNAERDVIDTIGDPTEAALAVAAARLGMPAHELVETLPRVAEIPFDSDRKRMTTVHRIVVRGTGDLRPPLRGVLATIQELDGQHIAFTKGAIDSVMEIAAYVWDDDHPKELNASWRERIASANAELASQGMRVLAVAFRPLDGLPEADQLQSVEQDLILVGMLALIDPPRPEVRQAVEECRTAGIRPIMITGDHPLTAANIAQQLRISQDDRVASGADFEQWSDADLESASQSTSVYARVAPKHKLRLVKSLQKQGHIVAMTGDGVNDAPALKQAHIGVAMGITGTDVAKEASQMVLLDDDFATIVKAVKEGRVVYENIRKFVKYTMTSNAGEIWVMIFGPLLGMPLPLLPLQILWVNLVTDGLPGLALAMEPAERDTMQRPPHPPQEHVFGRGMGWDIAWIGLLMGVVSLVMGYVSWTVAPEQEAHWRTLIFTVLTLSQLGNAMAIRSNRDSLFRIGVFSNRLMVGSLLLTLVLQMAVIYLPPFQTIFKTEALSVWELCGCFAISTIVFWSVELQKLLKRTLWPPASSPAADSASESS